MASPCVLSSKILGNKNRVCTDGSRMPKSATCVLLWSSEQDAYELRRRGDAFPLHIQDGDQFIQSLDDDSFAFRGQHGRLTLRKEARQHGEGYWYAYRNQDR